MIFFKFILKRSAHVPVSDDSARTYYFVHLVCKFKDYYYNIYTFSIQRIYVQNTSMYLSLAEHFFNPIFKQNNRYLLTKYAHTLDLPLNSTVPLCPI